MADSRFDPQAPDRSSAGTERATTPASMAEQADVPVGEDGRQIDLLGIVGQAMTISREYQTRTIERPLARAYRAWQNQHAEGSKYLGPAWKGRSRLFVPKTRSAVRKNLATAASALFSTEDVVNLAPTFEDDPQQAATASVIKADLDHRLTQASHKFGLPWFLTTMGASLDAQLTGVCISKQFWEFEEVETGAYHPKQVPALHPETNDPLLDVVIDPATQMPTVVPVMEEVDDLDNPVMRVVKDRPAVEVYALENVGVDPAAAWVNPVQRGRWFIAKIPIGIADARAMLNSPGRNGRDNGWLPDIPDSLLLKGRIEEDRAGARRTREGGADRYEDAKATGDLDIVWLQENFVRVGGRDYHFWSIGRWGFISRVRETHEAYPEFDGERPYAMGVASIDTHRVFPMSPVESWQPLQLELNDITNLRQDTLKRAIAPLTKIKAGANVDRAALMRRGQPDAVITMNAMDDIEFVPTPGPTSAAYTETSQVNALMDELSGSFSTSSVQTSRQLNETVGGMQLMSGASNSVSEFDLRVWIETWVEPVLRQLVHLIRVNESDERILAIAGQKARVWEKFEYLPSLNDFEQCELTLRVNVGIGSADPMQKLSKLKMALEMLAPAFGEMKAQGISLNGEALITEVFGQAGFRDGRRFFKFEEPAEPPPDPKVEIEKARIASNEKIAAEDNATKKEVEALKQQSALILTIVEELAAREARKDGLDAEIASDDRKHSHERTTRAADMMASRASKEHDAYVRSQDSERSGSQRLKEIAANAAGRASNGHANGSGKGMDEIMAKLDGHSKALDAIVAHLMAQGGKPNPYGMSPAGGGMPAI